MTMACMRPMSVGHLAALGMFTPAARPAEMTTTGAVLKMLPPTALPTPAGAQKAPVAPVKKALTKEEKRNRITTWGGNGRVQMITGAVVSRSVVVRPTAVAKPRGPAKTAAATSAQPQTSDFALNNANANELQKAAVVVGTTRKTSDKKQKMDSYRKMFAAVDDQINRESAAMAASPMLADYVFVEADGRPELIEGGKLERAAFWAAWRKDLRGVFQYIREYECGEVDEKWYLFDVKPAEETIFGNAFSRYVGK
mmetsp:Transcript_10604/g.25883  ORF Transcript_10604/g.25883 Transcript_10604/m.25883 type:complete len:254 (-) Transcript_10604:320-1081(-)|eukprot:CAMPEP_0178997472 /NCGR_PEP_ID=MMETSP0795-20121207/8945_1 /TAXON_ID=88552 /ORGANISM="Amoebophrya sp., Strain Ameob2" /LENGTH=253 /DNA_ID=CAMNT_0020689981 /DNA_START=195 /DNA_END=956 /DNA_ORIENTATION=-